MTIEYAPRIYAPLFDVPASEREGGFVLTSYERMKEHAAYPSYIKVKVALPVALRFAAKSPYPAGVKVGVMKQIANDQEITLRQLMILLGWAARRAQHTGR